MTQIQKVEELQRQQLEAEAAERLTLMECDMDAIQTCKQQSLSWKDRYAQNVIIIIIIIIIIYIFLYRCAL